MTGPAPTPPIRHGQFGVPSAVWRYADAGGATVGWVCRFELPEGGKAVVPCIPDSGGIKWVSFNKPRPIYGLELLAASPQAQILVVEGEKAADAGRRLLGNVKGIVVVTWPGGCKAVKHTDWSSLKGRQVILWPDADAKTDRDTQQIKPIHQQNGTSAMLELAGILSPIASLVRIVRLPEPGVDLADGWDLADAEVDGWDAAGVLAYIKERKTDPASLVPPPSGPSNEELEAMAAADRERDRREREAIDLSLDQEPPPAAGRSEPADEPPIDGLPYRYLGHDHGTYYYLPKGSRQVVPLTASQHNSSGLLMLAPLSWWERICPGKGKSPVDWLNAQDTCIQTQHRVGIFDTDRVRGRGAWWDNKRSVLHCGDQLIVDRVPMPVTDLESTFIYEESTPLRAVTVEPLRNDEAVKFSQLCQMFSWSRAVSGRLLAGWCVLAPICGALKWRPHIWITAPAGGGKSWVMDNVVKKILGDFNIQAGRDTTEAGIRQSLNSDALPVVFDEGGDASTQAARVRIQQVLSLMRGSSSETGARTLKGTVGGKAMTFRIRSCFALASVAVGIIDHADATRITVLDLDKPRRKFDEILTAVNSLLTQDYADRFIARTLSLIDVIRANAVIFGEAGAKIGGTQRFGDQIGALLAGAYSLHSSNLITPEAAKEWIDSQNWDEERQSTERPDEEQCLARIAEHVVRLEKGRERTVGELVGTASNQLGGGDVSALDAYEALLRIGIRVENLHVKISNDHPAMSKLLEHTPWSAGWARVLARLSGSEKVSSIRFGSAVRGRAVSLPVGMIAAQAGD